MTTNNHPAHGPVSLDRLHQISEILSKAAAQSDGGNLGYAMADAVKVIDGVIAARNVEPVGTFRKGPCGYHPSFHEEAVPLYAAPPAPVVPVVPEEKQDDDGSVTSDFDHGWNACRAAMLQAGNSPVTPDGWIPVSERMPEDGEHVIVFHPRDGVMQITFFFAYGKWWDAAEDEGGLAKSYFTHWQPLPAAPQKEVK
ncbi:DUF551 domain-containing protein [Salmonella enterica]